MKKNKIYKSRNFFGPVGAEDILEKFKSTRVEIFFGPVGSIKRSRERP